MGKSRTAVKLAQRFGGEVINCDALQVYQGFDIGTDKPSEKDRANIPHHLLDILPASHQFTAAEFVERTLKALELILSRKRLPIIAGGTGLYLKALLEGLFPEGKKDAAVREKLEKLAKDRGLEILWERLREVDPGYAKKIGKRDRVRIIRALEVHEATSKPLSEHFLNTRAPLKDFQILKIGLKLERKDLYRCIEERVDQMFEKGLVREVESLLLEGVGESAPPFRAIGYRHVLNFLNKALSLEETISLTKKDTRHYAKRQMTWFRKMEGIQWFSPDDYPPIEDYVRAHLG